jgi:2-keto-4-pentenoate hydratase/2-oxohepta-3-ene-1,7-dioic acid hydratase in catechol pathway
LKYLRFSTDPQTRSTAGPGTPGVHWGVIEGDGITQLDGAPYSTHGLTGHTFALGGVNLLPACCPSKIVCVGRNYLDHAKELAHDVPTKPLIFYKPPSSLLASGGQICYPPDVSRMDYEGEIGIVIGKRMRHLGASESALGYIFGFTCVNDVTGRDLQDKDGQWARAKGFDTFCPVGPVIATDLDPAALAVETTLNGEVRQKGGVSQLIFSFDVILRWISRFCTLEPGDLIATGTPAGVGPMQVGDTVEVKIEGIGTLRNTVVKEEGVS